MSRFAQYTIANVPEPSKPLLARVHKALGFVPNLYATFAESPPVLEGYLALSASLDKGALSPTERQLVEIAVSTENHCAYCVAAHSTIAGMLKARPEIVTAVRTGAPVGDAKIDALVSFTRAVVLNKGFVPETAVAAFLTAGYSKAQLLEVVGHVGLKVLANYTQDRKSTRLNSSHDQISYAVFCLKKKTNKGRTRIISTGKDKIDGVVTRDHRFPVGLIDVLQDEADGPLFRILPKPNLALTPPPIY